MLRLHIYIWQPETEQKSLYKSNAAFTHADLTKKKKKTWLPSLGKSRVEHTHTQQKTVITNQK